MFKICRSQKSRWFISVIKADANLLAILVVLGILISALGLSMAVFSQKLIDEIIPSKDFNYLLQGVLIVALLLFIKVLLGFVQAFIGELHGKRFNLNLIDTYFRKLLFLPKTFFDQNQTGTLITRMHDAKAIHSTIAFVVNTLILSVVTVLVSAFFLFYYSVAIGCIALASFPAFLASALLFKKPMKNRIEAMYIANGRNESNYISSIQNSDLIKSHNKQGHFSKKNYEAYGDFQDKTFRAAISGISFGATSEAIGTLFYLFMLSFAAYQALSGVISIGEFTATIGVATGMLYPLGALGNSVMHLQSASVAFDRMYEVVESEIEFSLMEDERKISLPAIQSVEALNLCFSYNEAYPLLKDVNFSAAKGEIVCIFGNNGSGKSTLLNLLVSLYSPKSGCILFNDNNISVLSVSSLREKVAIVSQQTSLFDGTLIDNICLSNTPITSTDTLAYLSELGFDQFIGPINGGYNSHITEGGNNLSGGQKQIISLARALNKRPDLLLVDEATASLDDITENFVIEKLQEFARGGGIVIMVSHRLKPAKASTKIVILDQGAVTETGSPKELLTKSNLFSNKLNSIIS